MKTWLLKSESETYSWEDLVKEGRTSWTGVRNFTARNNLKEARIGDRVLFYHSGDERAIVGIAEVVGEYYPDKTATEGDWVTIDIAPVKAITRPVSLELMKNDSALQAMIVLRQPRLSVSPVSEKEYERICKLGEVEA